MLIIFCIDYVNLQVTVKLQNIVVKSKFVLKFSGPEDPAVRKYTYVESTTLCYQATSFYTRVINYRLN